MAGPRINQFADDLGINRSSAKKLMKKARGRKDGGSKVSWKATPRSFKARMQRFEDAERIFQRRHKDRNKDGKII